jgi:hypothetical protein
MIITSHTLLPTYITVSSFIMNGLAPNTLVRTNRGDIPIADVSVGD